MLTLPVKNKKKYWIYYRLFGYKIKILLIAQSNEYLITLYTCVYINIYVQMKIIYIFPRFLFENPCVRACKRIYLCVCGRCSEKLPRGIIRSITFSLTTHLITPVYSLETTFRDIRLPL